MAQTMFEKIWNSHAVTEGPGGQTLLYVDRHLLLCLRQLRSGFVEPLMADVAPNLAVLPSDGKGLTGGAVGRPIVRGHANTFRGSAEDVANTLLKELDTANPRSKLMNPAEDEA